MTMHALNHFAQILDVTFIPERTLWMGIFIGRRMDRAVFRIDDTPAAFCSHLTHFVECIWACVPHAGTVRHLIEPVFARYRANFYWFKQDVVTWITGHD